jgi:hypothetical protein
MDGRVKAPILSQTSVFALWILLDRSAGPRRQKSWKRKCVGE